MNTQDLIPALLLTLLSLALTSGAAVILLLMHWRRQRRLHLSEQFTHFEPLPILQPNLYSQRPVSWMSVRSRSIQVVQTAFRLTNAKPCSWLKGLSGDLRLFIAPPVNGWILITGSGLPDPFDDVDRCFRFLLNISEKLGEVQLFCANQALSYHAWIRAEHGRIIRGYAWGGRTVWNQGAMTQPEQDLAMKCFQYFEKSAPSLFEDSDILASNTEKVPQLAARWSIDPANIDESTLDHTCGISGEPARLY